MRSFWRGTEEPQRGETNHDGGHLVSTWLAAFGSRSLEAVREMGPMCHHLRRGVGHRGPATYLVGRQRFVPPRLLGRVRLGTRWLSETKRSGRGYGAEKAAGSLSGVRSFRGPAQAGVRRAGAKQLWKNTESGNPLYSLSMHDWSRGRGLWPLLLGRLSERGIRIESTSTQLQAMKRSRSAAQGRGWVHRTLSGAHGA